MIRPVAAPRAEPASRKAADDPAQAPVATGRAPARPRLDELYRDHASWLLRALRRRFGRDQAEDLSQEAFTRLQGQVPAEIRRPRALLLTIATNAARERLRHAGRHAPEAAAAVEVREDDRGLDGDQESLVLLKQVVLALPPKLREVFLLSRVEGLTNAEIARRCGVSVKTVEMRMTRALALCAARLRG